MAHVSHRLKNAFEGALAGGGDSASSPLYVFGPFLRLLAASGAGAVCLGAPLWMVVATVVVVSVMYRHVMHWISDGSGGSGLGEEEFGGWAVKVNASITAIEYTLTFLVSVAAMVTFIADRANGLGRQDRTALAVGLSVAVGLVVNRGPRLAARVFGPATAAMLLLLWVLVGAVVLQHGLRLPSFHLAAFNAANLHVTLGGYVRLLALITGIEVFANLVAAYEGPPRGRATKAFRSLVIVMITTLVTMVVVGPAIYEVADPGNPHVSVFTQLMDHLLPAPLAWLGTLVGLVVLLSAAAASAQGLQNLALGLRQRHYVPAGFGQRNRFDVADRPVILQVVVVVVCFVGFGTHEETYLALYAAGVFVLLGLTGWAAVKRLTREVRAGLSSAGALVGAMLAALVTSAAAVLIFYERFEDGTWAYAGLLPALYAVFSWQRAHLGAPTSLEEQLGRVLAEQKTLLPVQAPSWPQSVLVVVDGSRRAEVALVAAAATGAALCAPVAVCQVGFAEASRQSLSGTFRFASPPVRAAEFSDVPALVRASGTDLVVAAHDLQGLQALSRASDAPLLVVPGGGGGQPLGPTLTRVLVGLDGSPEAEATLPYAARLLSLGAKVTLVLVPDGDTSGDTLLAYAERLASGLRQHGPITVAVGGSGPARTLVERAKEDAADLVIVARHGRGGVHRAEVPLGSVPARLLADLGCSLLVVPATSPSLVRTGPQAEAAMS